MAEFYDDQHRASYIAALNTEKAGYDARVEQAKVPPGDKDAEARYKGRIKQVDAELKRLGATDASDSEA